jgi:uncharacterized membrane protein YeaQ/YmgE (transglycosylase-associated protein family)
MLAGYVLMSVRGLAVFILWLLAGLLAGWLAGLVTRGKGYGCCGDVVLGWLGAIVGGFIFSALFGLHTGGFIGSILVAFVGAVILIICYRLVTSTFSSN